MTSGIRTIIYPVRDLTTAKALYGAFLGVAPNMDQPYYVNFTVAGQDVGFDPHGHKQGITGPIAYWHVDDLEARLKLLLDAGAEPLQGLKDVGGGKLSASVKDADGNIIGLLQSG